eukprot:g66057.t1
MDYVSLKDGAELAPASSAQRSTLRALAGLAGLVLLGWAGAHGRAGAGGSGGALWFEPPRRVRGGEAGQQSGQQGRERQPQPEAGSVSAPRVKASGGPGFQLFTPKQGLSAVTVKPLPPGPLALPPPLPKDDAAGCLFSYGEMLEQDEGAKKFCTGSTRQEAYLYGARYEPSLLLAFPTGKTTDVVKGRVFCWPHDKFAARIKSADKMRGCDPANASNQTAGRMLSKLVKKDGSVVEAFWYFQKQPDRPIAAAPKKLIREKEKEVVWKPLRKPVPSAPVVEKHAPALLDDEDEQDEDSFEFSRDAGRDLSHLILTPGTHPSYSLATDIAEAPPGFRSGFVALVGRPNVGKSTLVNTLVGQKVAITSPLAQTTRNRLRAIVTTPKAQLVLLDTPGIHKPHHLLGSRLVKTACDSIGEVDLVLFLVDGSQYAGRGDRFVADVLRRCTKPVLVCLNKNDLVPPEEAEALAESYRLMLADNKEGVEDVPWPMFITSATTGEGTEELIEALSSRLPLGPHLYPPDAVSDQPEHLLLGELIREQVLRLTREEVPHSVAVVVERVQETGKQTAVLATVLVERPSQKGILIGKGGSMLRDIGSNARVQMQKVIDGPVYLELFVKVEPQWRSNPFLLGELGYNE